MPCYNAAHTISETIDSVLAQEVDHELIAVDDGSTDDTALVLATYGSRIKVVSTANRGVSAARTLGAKVAKGAFLQFLDSDDLLTPGTLSARRTALQLSGSDVAHTDWQKFEKKSCGIFSRGDVVRPDVGMIAVDPEVAAATSTFWAPPAALLYRSEIVERIGPWSPRLPIIQDARYLFDAASRGATFEYVPGIGALYRVSSNSLSRVSVERFISDCAINASEIEEYWRATGKLTTPRCDALAEMWRHIATSALLNGFGEFELARKRYNSVARPCTSFEIAKFLRYMFGPKCTAATFGAFRAGRDWTLGRQ